MEKNNRTTEYERKRAKKATQKSTKIYVLGTLWQIKRFMFEM